MKKLFLMFVALSLSSLVQAHTPFKSTANVDESFEVQQIKRQRKIFRTRAAALTVSSAFAIAGGGWLTVLGSYGILLCNELRSFGCNQIVAVTVLTSGAILLAGGFCMLGFGIYNFIQASAETKRLKRLRLKKETQERQRLRNTLTFREENN